MKLIKLTVKELAKLAILIYQDTPHIIPDEPYADKFTELVAKGCIEIVNGNQVIPTIVGKLHIQNLLNKPVY